MAGKTIKGITIQIDGDATGLGKVLKEIDKESGKLTGNLKQVNAALKLDPTNTELLSQKQRILGDAIETTRGRLDALKKAQEEASKSVGNYDAWAAAYKPIQEQIVATKERIKDLTKQQTELAKSGDTTSDAYQALGREIESLGDDLKTLQKRAKAVTDEFGNPISQDEYDKLQREIVFTNDRLKTLGEELDDTETKMRDLAQETSKAVNELNKLAIAEERAGTESSGLGALLSGDVAIGLGLAGTAVTAVVGGLLEAEEQSREYRAEMGKLDAAFDSSGHSAETATETYKTLQSVIGETDQSVEAAQQIALLADSEQTAAKWAGYAAGLVGKFGDALQPESFYESANETLKLGEATGAFTQMLEGCGMNVEQFNEDLAACTTEQEKQALMLSVTEAALGDAAARYRETNAETIRANEANEAWNESMAGVGAAIGPIITDVKLFGAELLGDLVPAIQTGAKWVGEGFSFIQTVTENVMSDVKEITEERLTSIKSAYKENGGGMKGIAAATMEAIKGYYVDGWNVADKLTGGKLSEIYNTTRDRLSNIKSVYEENGGGMRGIAAATMEAIKGYYTDGWRIADKLTGGKLSDIRDTITEKMDEAKAKVREGIEKIKGFFDFKFEWPKMPMPHFVVTPKGWEIGDLLTGSIPKLDVQWYAKGGILPSAAIFGAYGGKLLGGGEAGQEAVLPLDSFYRNLDAIMAKYSGGHSGLIVNVNIENFDNASGQDIDQLAVAVADVMQIEILRREAAF